MIENDARLASVRTSKYSPTSKKSVKWFAKIIAWALKRLPYSTDFAPCTFILFIHRGQVSSERNENPERILTKNKISQHHSANFVDTPRIFSIHLTIKQTAEVVFLSSERFAQIQIWIIHFLLNFKYLCTEKNYKLDDNIDHGFVPKKLLLIIIALSVLWYIETSKGW